MERDQVLSIPFSGGGRKGYASYLYDVGDNVMIRWISQAIYACMVDRRARQVQLAHIEFHDEVMLLLFQLLTFSFSDGNVLCALNHEYAPNSVDMTKIGKVQ